MGMSDDKILEALKKMRAVAEELRGGTFAEYMPTDLREAVPARIDPEVQIQLFELDARPFAHVLFMLDETAELVRRGHREKAFRWLGFLQGVMWAQGWCSLEALKKMNNA